LQSDRNKFSRRADRNGKMATKGHGCGHREDRKQKKNPEMDLELVEVRARIEKLTLRMQRGCKDALGV
jgi:hypothetical protein